MLKRMRLAGRQLSFTKTNNNKSDAPLARTDSFTDKEPVTFFSLPAEIRNEIYTLVATETNLMLPLSKPKKGAPIPSILLASRQIRREFLPILLSEAKISVLINNYDFANLIRALDAQSDIARLALSSNENLTIYLQVAHVPTKANREDIWNWVHVLVKRYEHLQHYQQHDGKPTFRYDVKFRAQMRPPRAANQYANRLQMQWDLLGCHVRMLGNVRMECKSKGAQRECAALLADLSTRWQALREAADARERRNSITTRGIGVGIGG